MSWQKAPWTGLFKFRLPLDIKKQANQIELDEGFRGRNKTWGLANTQTSTISRLQ